MKDQNTFLEKLCTITVLISVVISILAFASARANAEAIQYKFDNAMQVQDDDQRLTKNQFVSIWNSSIPACLKDGATFKGANEAYVNRFGNDKSLCTKSTRDLYHKKGKEFAYIQADQLPLEMIKVK